MLEFKKPTLDDIKTIRSFYNVYKEFSCENTAVNIVVWQSQFDFKFCIENDVLYTKTTYDGKTTFAVPVARDMKAAVEKVKEYVKSKNIPLAFFCAAGERLEEFKRVCGDEYDFKSNRNPAEYIYAYDDLANLAGKKYHGKRNHIASFKKNYNWTYESLKEENIDDILKMAEVWYSDNLEKRNHWLDVEHESIKNVLKSYAFLGVKGGVLRVDGNIVAVTFGNEINSEVFDVSFEKALVEFGGAYPMINQQFVLNELSSYRYINREDDMGIEGLRRSKLSYHPTILLEKYVITPKDENNG